MPPNAGKRGNLAADIIRRLRLFHDRAWEALWSEVPPHPTRNGARRPQTRSQTAALSDTLPTHVADTIRGLVEEGAYSKAAKHLLSRGTASLSDPKVAEKLSALHPKGRTVQLGEDEPLPANLPIDWDLTKDDWEVRALKAIQSFPCGSAAGPSGLRPSHLKDCLKRAGPTAALKGGLSDFV